MNKMLHWKLRESRQQPSRTRLVINSADAEASEFAGEIAGEIGSRRIAIKKPGPSLLLVSVLTGQAKLALSLFIRSVASLEGKIT